MNARTRVAAAAPSGCLCSLGCDRRSAASRSPPAATPVPPPPLEPATLARLKAMSDLLKGTPRFTFRAVTDRETPSETGPMLDFVSVSKVTVERPDKVRVDTTGDPLRGIALVRREDPHDPYEQELVLRPGRRSGDDRRDRPDAPGSARHSAAGGRLSPRGPVREDDRGRQDGVRRRHGASSMACRAGTSRFRRTTPTGKSGSKKARSLCPAASP